MCQPLGCLLRNDLMVVTFVIHLELVIDLRSSLLHVIMCRCQVAAKREHGVVWTTMGCGRCEAWVASRVSLKQVDVFRHVFAESESPSSLTCALHRLRQRV